MALITIPGHDLKVDSDVLERLLAESKQPQPVEGQVYRHVKDALPFGISYYFRRWNGKTWQFRHGPNGDWEDVAGSQTEGWWRDNLLVPYPPPPTFRVGQWVRRLDGASGTQRIAYVAATRRYSLTDSKGAYYGNFGEAELRPATPEEIAAATRITARPRVILKRKADGLVFQLWKPCEDSPSSWWADPLSNLDYAFALAECDITTETYEILDSYTIPGVK